MYLANTWKSLLFQILIGYHHVFLFFFSDVGLMFKNFISLNFFSHGDSGLVG
jgi:hypothetical protein